MLIANTARSSVAVAVTAVLLGDAAFALNSFSKNPTFIRTNSNYVGFRTVQPILNPANCPNNDFYAVPTASDSKAALAVLLTANVAGRTVSISISDTACEPSSGRPVVTDVTLEQ